MYSTHRNVDILVAFAKQITAQSINQMADLGFLHRLTRGSYNYGSVFARTPPRHISRGKFRGESGAAQPNLLSLHAAMLPQRVSFYLKKYTFSGICEHQKEILRDCWGHK